MTAPWQSQKLVNIAIDTACDVRHLDLEQIKREISKLSLNDVLNLTIVLASMVDVYQTTGQVLAWTKEPPEPEPEFVLTKPLGRPKNV